MKCVTNKATSAVMRVDNERAAALAARGDWAYASKAAWKAAGRRRSVSRKRPKVGGN